MMMAAAVARAVAINYRAVQILLNKLRNRKNRRAAVNLNSKFIQNLDCACAESSAKNVCAAICSNESWC